MGFWKDITRTVRNAFVRNPRHDRKDRGGRNSLRRTDVPDIAPDISGGVRATGSNPSTRRSRSRMRNHTSTYRRKRNRQRIARRSRTINRLKAKGKVTRGY